MCSSIFVKSWVAYQTSHVPFFQLLDEEGDIWAALNLVAGSTATYVSADIGFGDNNVEVDVNETLPLFFPAQSWVRACTTLDTVTGVARIVADGKVLKDASYPKLKDLADKMLTNFTIRVGKGASSGGNTGSGINCKFTNINMFSEPPSLEKMIAMTTPGDGECGAVGDFLNWDEAEWNVKNEWLSGAWSDWVLVINASKVVEVEWMAGPCWRETKIRVYQIDNLHKHSDCMNHCKKIGNGRSPSVVTEEDWMWLIKEVDSVSLRNQDHCNLWLSATEGDSGKRSHF